MAPCRCHFYFITNIINTLLLLKEKNMPVIIKLNEIPTSTITVDSTEYTVDNTTITADRITIVSGASSSEYSVLITPREYAEDVIMDFYHELKETKTTISATTEIVNGYMKVNFNMLVVEGDSFELTIKNTNDKILWKGKAYATEQTDLQNFQFIQKDKNNNIIKL